MRTRLLVYFVLLMYLLFGLGLEWICVREGIWGAELAAWVTVLLGILGVFSNIKRVPRR